MAAGGGGVERIHRMELQYDGTGLHGWAKQPGLSTVEGSLEAALQTVLGKTPAMSVAGRTDAGVHARRQVVSLSLPEDLDLGKLTRSLNALTPPGIVVTRVVKTGREFDARADAVSRSYRYYLSTQPLVPPFWRRYCWAPTARVDIALLRASAALISGRHDFVAFTPAETEHTFFERTVLKCRWRSTRADLSGGGGGRRGTAGPSGCQRMLYLEIEADAFLRHMVRALVGTMVEVAQGKRGVDDFARLLEGGRRDTAGRTAPPRGLFLWDVTYASRGGRRPYARMDW